MLKLTKIRMEYIEKPVGIGELPWFSWVLESDKKNVIQKAYQLQIGADAAFEELLYDSGWVESEESVHVEAVNNRLGGGRECQLSSCTRYYVRVRVRDGEEESSFAQSSFVTALLSQEEWQAYFVTAETESDKDESASTCLRKEITIQGKVKEAYACVTALGLYRLFINGEKVGRAELTPGWTSYHKHLCYQTYDVTGALKEGVNTLGAMLGAGWYKGKMGFLLLRNNYGTRTALLLQLTVRYEDGRVETFVTDESWKGARGPVTFSEIYDGECYDAGKEIAGWAENGADTAAFWDCERVEFPMEALTAQAGSMVERMDELCARVIRTPKGETVLDFSQNLTGWPQFSVDAPAGTKIVLQCFETLDAEGNVYTENLRTAKQEIHYICKGGQESYHPHFTFMGFRYIHVISWPGQVKAEDFKAYALHSAMEQTGSFSCSHPLVNQLQHNILWGLKGNFVDIPTDCPQRDERMGWTGDAQIFCRTACYLMNTYTFFRKWLKDVAADQTPDGGVAHVVPDIISGKEAIENDWLLSQGSHSAAAWADVAVINPWTMYLTFGDKVILEEQYESMKKWIGFMREHAVDYIWNYRLQFGDWVALDAQEGSYFGATPNDLTCTAYYAYSTGLFSKIAAILGKEEDAAEYAALYEKIVEKFQRTFFTEDGVMTAQTQTAHIVALYFGLTPEKYRAMTAQRLVRLLEKENGHLVTGFVGTPYFCHALSQNGYVKEAYELLLKEDFPSWLYQVKAGATTVWEHWDGLKPDGTMWSPDMNSFNHYAYGAVGDWLYRVVLGMELSEKEPGYHHSIISPKTGDAFDWAEGAYESMYGRLSVRWEKGAEEGERVMKIRIPHNTTCEIRLEEGARVVDAGELVFTEKDGIFTAECGSGEWSVRYQK